MNKGLWMKSKGQNVEQGSTMPKPGGDNKRQPRGGMATGREVADWRSCNWKRHFPCKLLPSAFETGAIVHKPANGGHSHSFFPSVHFPPTLCFTNFTSKTQTASHPPVNIHGHDFLQTFPCSPCHAAQAQAGWNRLP